MEEESIREINELVINNLTRENVEEGERKDEILFTEHMRKGKEIEWKYNEVNKKKVSHNPRSL